jgi:hypothetical protein
VTWPEPELDDGPEPELRPEPDDPELDELELDLCDELDLCELEPELVLPEPDELAPLEVAWFAVLCEADEAWALAAPGRT